LVDAILCFSLFSNVLTPMSEYNTLFTAFFVASSSDGLSPAGVVGSSGCDGNGASRVGLVGEVSIGIGAPFSTVLSGSSMLCSMVTKMKE
jgi:hypothetical protein